MDPDNARLCQNPVHVFDVRMHAVRLLFRLTAEFDVLTPLFLGGATQSAELRTSSIKGAMRFWYRALDPHFRELEPRIFGGGGKEPRQSLLLLRCQPGARADERRKWKDVGADQFNQGSGRQTKNGLTYLGFPFAMKGNEDRTAIVPGARFSVVATCRSASKEADLQQPLRAALSSLWALGHFGSLGMRSRRGFGAIALTAWRLENPGGEAISSDDFDALPVLCREVNADVWSKGAKRGLDVMRRWFGTFEHGTESKTRTRGKGKRRDRQHHLHFGPRSRFVVHGELAERDGWRNAMLSLGRELQEFRQRKSPDYEVVKEHVRYTLRDGSQRITRAPERATFGLPLTFRYGSIPNGKSITFAPCNGERHGSPLFLRPVLIGDKLASLFLRLDGDIPGIDTPVGIRGSGPSLDAAQTNAVDAFIDAMKEKP